MRICNGKWKCTKCHEDFNFDSEWGEWCSYCFTPIQSFGCPFYDTFYKESSQIESARAFDRVMGTNRAEEIRQHVLARIREIYGPKIPFVRSKLNAKLLNGL